MFSVKLVARPDARMVEVPLEIEAELPREFEGAALLAASGLPRKVKIKAQKDALKLSTAYRTDQLVGDIVRSALRGTALDVQRVQEAVTKFIRTVRERRQEGATLLISSNGRGKIDVLEQIPQGGRGAAPASTPGNVARLATPVSPDRLAALERRVTELESGLARMVAGGDSADRVGRLDERVSALQAQMGRALAGADVAGPGFDQRPGARAITRAMAGTHQTTAVEAYAEGLRHELQASASAAFARSRTDTERCDKAAALAAEAEMLGAPADGTAQRLREASMQAAARESALARLAQEIEFYAPPDLPVAEQLLKRLEDGPRAPDPAPSLEPVAQALVRAAKGGDCKPRTAWLKRCAALCAWQLVEPARGEALNPEWHHAVDSGGDSVVRLACPGLKRVDGSGLVRARVHVDPKAVELPEEPDEPEAVPEPLSPPPSDPATASQTARAQEAAVHAKDAAPKADPADRAVLSPPLSIDQPFYPPPPTPDQIPEPVRADQGPETDRAEIHDTPRDVAPVPSPVPQAPFATPFVTPFGDLGEGEIKSDEAAAAAKSASRIPKIVSEDLARSDEALATEVALAVETEASEADPEWAQVARGLEFFDAQPAGPDEVPAEEVSDDQVEEVHELAEPVAEESNKEK